MINYELFYIQFFLWYLIMIHHSLFRVYYSAFWYLKNSFILRQAWWIKYFANSLLSFAFFEVQSCCTRMGKYMATNRLFWISMGHSISWISHHLICHINSYIKLLWKLHKFAKNFTENLLSLGELSSASIIISENCHDWIDN